MPVLIHFATVVVIVEPGLVLFWAALVARVTRLVLIQFSVLLTVVVIVGLGLILFSDAVATLSPISLVIIATLTRRFCGSGCW